MLSSKRTRGRQELMVVATIPRSRLFPRPDSTSLPSPAPNRLPVPRRTSYTAIIGLDMPNWGYLFISLAYNVALSIWIGGGIVLGALVAPTLFRELPSRPAAGAVFGGLLRKFARLRVAGLFIIIVAAGLKFLVWETNTTAGNKGAYILLRWAAIAIMAACVFYEMIYLEKAIPLARMEGSGQDVPSASFQRLHKRAERILKISLVAAVVALFLN